MLRSRSIWSGPGQISTGSTRGASATSASSVRTSSGKDTTTGPGRPCMATRNARAISSGKRAASSTSTTHFAMLAEKLLVVDLLERFALPHPARDLPDEQDHRRGVLGRDVDAGAGVGGAGSAGDEADARPPRELAVGFRHHGGPAFVAADQHVDRGVVQRVEHGQITLARNAGEPLHPLRDQLIDQDAAARAARRNAHEELFPWNLSRSGPADACPQTLDGGEGQPVLREAWVEDFDSRVRIALSRLPAGEDARCIAAILPAAARIVLLVCSMRLSPCSPTFIRRSLLLCRKRYANGGKRQV